MAARRKIHKQEIVALDFSAVEVRLSGVEGRGVFAARDIKAGEFVCSLSGRLVPSSTAQGPDYDRMALQISDDWWLEEEGHPDDFINHRCDPNLRFSPQGDFFQALKAIRKGEELFFDYATSVYFGGWSVECLCGAPNCRGQITGFEDLNPDMQHKILRYALPFIRQKYE